MSNNERLFEGTSDDQVPLSSSSWFARIFPSQLEESSHPIVMTQYGVYYPTYQLLPSASFCIDELAPYTNDMQAVIRMNNETILLFESSINMFCEELNMPATEYSKFLFLYFDLEDDTCTTCQIFGNSEEKLLETAIYLARLKVSDHNKEITQITWRCDDDFECDHSHVEQLAVLIDAFAVKKIRVFHSDLDRIVSAAFASRPYPMDFSLSFSFVDMDAFMEQLQARTTPFGSFGLARTEHEEKYDDCLQRLFPHLHRFEMMHIRHVPDDLILQLLTAPLKSIAFSTGRDTANIGLSSSMDILPSEIDVMVTADERNAFPTKFILSFLQQVAKSNRLERFGFCLMQEYPPVPVAVTKALCQALAANTHLDHLEMTGCNEAFHVQGWMDLLVVLEQHVSLRTLRIPTYPIDLDPGLTHLKRLLKRNRKIEHMDLSEVFLEVYDEEMETICAVTRFFYGSQSLLGVEPNHRLALVNAALTRNSENDMERTGIVLHDHADLLCELLHGTGTGYRSSCNYNIVMPDGIY